MKQGWKRFTSTLLISAVALSTPAAQAWTIPQAWLTPTPVQKNIRSVFLESDVATSNSWVFTGGRVTQGSYTDIQGARSYIGQFEEFIRWTRGGGGKAGQRYTISTAYDGQTLKDIVDTFDARIAQQDPRVVAYMVGAEDYSGGTKHIPAFQENLRIFLKKGLALRNGTGYVVIQTPCAGKDAAANAAIAEYVNAAKNVVDTFYDGPNQSSRTLFVNHYEKTSKIADWSTGYLTADGWPNAKGHLEMARQLAETAYGETLTGKFPTTEEKTAVSEQFPNDQIPVSAERESSYNGLYSPPSTLTPVQQTIRNRMLAGGVTWLFMGDSITHGALWMYGYDSVPQSFEKYLKDDLNRNYDIVINAGVSGATAKETLDSLNDRLNRYHPDVVSVMLGTNEAIGRTVSVTDYKEDLRKLLDAILTKGAIPVLRTPTPGGAPEWGEYIHEYAAAMCSVAEEAAYRDKVILIDQFTEWTSYLKLEPDGNDFTFLGRKIIDRDDISLTHPGPEGQLWMTHQLIDGLGLWTARSWICNLDYDLSVNLREMTSDFTPLLFYDETAGTLTLDVDLLDEQLKEKQTNWTVLQASLQQGTQSGTAVRGREATLSGVKNTEKASVSALVDVGGTYGLRIAFRENKITDITTVPNSETNAITKIHPKPNGSVIAVTTETDGSVSAVTTAPSGVRVDLGAREGNVAASVVLPETVTGAVVSVPARAGYTTVAVDGKSGEILKRSAPSSELDKVFVRLDRSTNLVLQQKANKFEDTTDHWGRDAIDFAAAHGLMTGVSETQFSPDGTMTRAALATVLARFFEVDNAENQGVQWAVQKGIFNGQNQQEMVTREQLAIMLWRSAGSPASSGNLNAFQDGANMDVSSRAAMSWAVEKGMLTGGRDQTLRFQAAATRAEIASALLGLTRYAIETPLL